MKIRNRIVFAFFGLLLLALAALVALPNKNQNISVATAQVKAQKDLSPVVDYGGQVTGSKTTRLRSLRGNRHDKQGPKAIEELPVGTEPLPEIDHWLSRLPAFPVTKSNLIVVGEVLRAKAYLSNDKSGVYSEFDIRVDDILKDDGGWLAGGNLLVAERSGGAVRFPSGRVQRYRSLHQGTPQIGRRYVLFLKRGNEAQGFLILTGYELREGYVVPLDGQDAGRQKTNLAFAAYDGAEEEMFLNSLREAISQTPKCLTR